MHSPNIINNLTSIFQICAVILQLFGPDDMPRHIIYNPLVGRIIFRKTIAPLFYSQHINNTIQLMEMTLSTWPTLYIHFLKLISRREEHNRNRPSQTLTGTLSCSASRFPAFFHRIHTRATKTTAPRSPEIPKLPLTPTRVGMLGVNSSFLPWPICLVWRHSQTEAKKFTRWKFR